MRITKATLAKTELPHDVVTASSDEHSEYTEVDANEAAYDVVEAKWGAYSIPSEGGSVVVYGATAPESDQNEQYLEVGGTPEDDIPTSVPATVVQDVPFVPTADGIYKSGSVAREGFVVHGNMGHQHVLEGAAREDDTAA